MKPLRGKGWTEFQTSTSADNKLGLPGMRLWHIYINEYPMHCIDAPTVPFIRSATQYNDVIGLDCFVSAEKLSQESDLVKYLSKRHSVSEEEWKAPGLTAVQISAAACARI